VLSLFRERHDSKRIRPPATTKRKDSEIKLAPDSIEGRLADLEQSEQAAREALVALEKELLQLRARHGKCTRKYVRATPARLLMYPAPGVVRISQETESSS
jgi:hypothetical protein